MYKQDWKSKTERRAKPTRASPLPSKEPSLDPHVRQYLESRELDFKLAIQNGWYGYTDPLKVPRVVMPASSQVNTWPYYQARAMNDALPRYLSPPVPRGDALMVIHPSQPAGLMILEGPMDALAAAGLGYVGVGLMGNRPNEPVLNHLVSLIDVYGERVYIIPDADALMEAQELAGKLWERGVTCYVEPLVGFKDLAGMPSEHRKEWFSRLTN